MATDTAEQYEIDYSGLPLGAQESMKAYIEQRRQTGGFLYSVLSNDLQMAFARANEVNTHRMRDYLVFLHNKAPSMCWGSPSKVKEWLEGKEDEF